MYLNDDVKSKLSQTSEPLREGFTMTKQKVGKSKKDEFDYVCNVRPDYVDFRDLMYIPTLYEVPSQIDVEDYKKLKVPILDQGNEGACTGFGLATVVHYLLLSRKRVSDPTEISPRMLYEMARRYDEWPGEDYAGSSARGAIKGWHKHGVCTKALWPYTPTSRDLALTDERSKEALLRPLGAYFRVNHQDLVAMHSAISEVGILYATGTVHAGWTKIPSDGVILLNKDKLGGHAFAIVGYDTHGFWIQNSWGNTWGKGGFACITYDDWLLNGTDVWVARLGAPVTLTEARSTAISHSAAANSNLILSFSTLRPHIISIQDDGKLKPGGDFGTSQADVERIFKDDFPRITSGWAKKRLLLYAHGGLVDEKSAVQRLSEYRATLLENEVYPISFIWHSDLWTTITNVLSKALSHRKPEGILDSSQDFMLDRLDDLLEYLVRELQGSVLWNDMKENALGATQNTDGGASIALAQIKELAKDPTVEIHIVGHSAGAIFHALIVQLLTTNGLILSGILKGHKGYNLPIESCTLWAPACTTQLFKDNYQPAIELGQVKRFALFTLTDKAEQDDNCANIYHKSLLYLVSKAFEKKSGTSGPQTDIPILGMQKFVDGDQSIKSLFKKSSAEWILSPNEKSDGSKDHSDSHHHGDFDDNEATVKATLARILGRQSYKDIMQFKPSRSSLEKTRNSLSSKTMT
jgi:Papain family cysteine protease